MTEADALAQLRSYIGGGTPGAEPPALGPVRDDPAVLEAQAAKQGYLIDAQAARADYSRTDIQRAARIVKLWQTANERIAQLHADIQGRRDNRLDWLTQRLPVGPGIGDDVTPADRVVLLAAWSTALDKARNASSANGATYADASPRDKLLAEAQRFGDDMQVRACLTVCFDESLTDTIDRWANAYSPATGALFTEYRELSGLIAGASFESLWEGQAFRAIDKPQEAYDLPRLVDAHNAAVRASNADANRLASYNQGAPTPTMRGLIDMTALIAAA